MQPAYLRGTHARWTVEELRDLASRLGIENAEDRSHEGLVRILADVDATQARGENSGWQARGSGAGTRFAARLGMADAARSSLVKALLDHYGRTYADELGAPVSKNTPAPLFQLLCMSMLLSARINADNAMRAARALIDAGLTTPRKMADAAWQERVDALTWHGYKRYDERTATMLGEAAETLLDRYGGDLRRLRAEAECDVRREHELLQRFNGIGATGAAIFLREAQVVWGEAYPFADDRVLKAAGQLNLGGSAEQLAELVARRDFARFAAALVRVDLDKAYDEIRQAA